MVHFGCGESEAGANVLLLQIGIVGEDVGFRDPGGLQLQHVLDANPHPPDAGPSAALCGIEGDT
jgi:hypothetical protein